MDDIRQWHLMFAVLVAATIHTVAVTLYLSLVRPPANPVLPPTIVFLQSPPPPAVILPPEPQTPPDADIPPIAAPAYDPNLPSVTLRRAEEPPPPEPVTIVEPEPVPLPEPVPEPLPKPEPLDLTQFEDLPPDEPAPIPQAKPTPPQIAAAPIPRAAPLARREASAEPNSNAPSGPATTRSSPSADSVPWPAKVEDLSPIQKQQLLTEFYVDDKSNWEPWYESRDDAWRRLDMGFYDPTAPLDTLDLQERQDLQPIGWDENEGPLTVQELEETLKKLVASGLESVLGRKVERVSALTQVERQRLLKAHYKDDPRWAIGIVDPQAGDDVHEIHGRDWVLQPIGWDENATPLTVQEVEAALEKLVKLGTTFMIGRDVRSAKALTHEERQIILKNYFGDNLRWHLGVIDPTVPPDHIDLSDPSHQHLRASGWDREESPYSIQEIEQTLKKMLDRKLKEQKARDASDQR